MFRLVICLSLFGFSASCDAQEWARKMFQEFEHDFGNVYRGANVEHRFVVENSYVEDIIIESVSSSCGCTSVSVAKRKLKTWEKTEIVAKFNTIGFSGFRQATITVRFARPHPGEVQLHVHGNIRTDVQVAPSNINFGTVSADSNLRQTVQVRRFGNANWRILDVRSSFPHIGVTLNETQRDSNRVNYILSVGIKPTTPAGLFQGELIVVAQDGNQELKIPIQFSGKIAATLQVSPTLLDFTNIKPGAVVCKKIILKAEQPFRIVDVTCENGSFSVQADGEKKSIHFLDVTYTGGGVVGRHETNLHFITDLPEQPNATLPAIVSIVSDDDEMAGDRNN